MTARQRNAALDAALSAMFRALEARGVPEHIRMALRQLEASAAAPQALTPSRPPSAPPAP